MRCEEARPLISAGLDEELEGTCVAQLTAHLAECVLCSTEQDALAATVCLLRDLPEVEPPPELRRRIGVALLEIERATVDRRAGFGWLRRPRAPAWAWGAAMGAVIATGIAIAPRHQASVDTVAVARNPTPAVGSRVSVPTRSVPAGRRELASAALPKKPASPGLQNRQPNLTAKLPTVPSVMLVAPPVPASSSTAAMPRLPRHQHFTRARSTHRITVQHRVSPAATAAAPVSGNSSPPQRPQTADDSSRLAQNVPTASTDPTTLPGADADWPADTTSMTQMASGGAMPAPPEQADNDLVELRRRLDDRPLQIPELGQLKPASETHPNHDGWIRF